MELKKRAAQLRLHALRMVHQANASHIGGCLSMADILAVLFGKILKLDPQNVNWPERDRLIISKGHAAAIYYAALAEAGFFPVSWLGTYGQNDSQLAGHITKHGVPGVEFSAGSLGHGLSVACGMAMGLKHDKNPARVFTIISDGEMDEGSIWEAMLFAPQHKLDNLSVILDYNKIQSFGSVKEVLDLEPLADKWKACRWAVREINGHDLGEIEKVLSQTPFEKNKPSVIIAHTVKGKGVSYMENQLKWHYSAPDEKLYAQAVKEIEATL